MKHLSSWTLLASLVGTLALAWAASPARGETPDLPGWETMRVIEQPGSPRRMIHADLTGDGRDELIVVVAGLARLDVYLWRDEALDQQASPDRPNDLPMAPELRRIQTATERPPREVLALAPDEDGRQSLLVLEFPPNRVVRYALSDDGETLERGALWDLLPGSLAGRDQVMLPAPHLPEPSILISFAEGFQTLHLAPQARATWHEPREQRGRQRWWTVDLNGDGKLDLLEWTGFEAPTIRWYEGVDSRLAPSQPLFDQRVQDVRVLEGGEGGAHLAILGGIRAGVVRTHRLAQGEASAVGGREALPLPPGTSTWAPSELDGRPAILAVDPREPRLLTATLSDAGWKPGPSFPIIAQVRQIAVTPDQRVLLWSRNADEPHVTTWSDGRFAYPRPMAVDALLDEGDPLREAVEAGDATIRVTGLGGVGERAWCFLEIRQSGERVSWRLVTWSPESASTGPVVHRYDDLPGLATTPGAYSEATWLGGDRVLARPQYDAQRVLLTTTAVRKPASLRNADLADFRLVPRGDDLLAARRTDGVLQWLDDELKPVDQVMLGDGRRLLDYTWVHPPDDQPPIAWALEEGGKTLHQLAPDEAGILRVADSFDTTDQGLSLTAAPDLGLLMTTSDGVIRLVPGRPAELKLVQSVESTPHGEVGPVTSAEPTIHRIFVTDVTGDGRDELLLSDDLRHQLTVTRAGEDGAWTPRLTWTVFEDSRYPYGRSDDDRPVGEPREILGLDIDGDGAQDLAFLSHDRLILYLAREPQRP